VQHYLWLLPFGLLVGAYGTLVGAGGAFVLMPVLLLIYPHESPETVTSISLAVVFFNGLSGSIAYGRMRRIDYRSGVLFSLATVPGAVAGALATSCLPHGLFAGLLGIIMVAGSCFIFASPHPNLVPVGDGESHRSRRHLMDSEGVRYDYSYRVSTGLGLSLIVGFISSLLGIGGGIIHVPALVRLLNFPVHVATATSHFMLAIMALAGTISHVAAGSFQHGIRRTLMLSAGVVIGAQIGAVLSDRLHGRLIIRILAVALALVGARLIWMAFSLPHGATP
jgi:uncharacterized protein